MALKDLMARLIPHADTSDTPEKIMGYQRKVPIHAGCTPDTPDTCWFVDTRANDQFRQFGEAVNNPESTQLTDLTSPDKPYKQTFIQWAGTWHELDRAYQAPHFKCPACIAAGLGYGLRCGTGVALWTAYSDAS